MNKKLIISLVLVLIISAAVIAGLILIRRNQDIRTSAQPATTLNFNLPSGNTVNVGEDINANIVINTNDNSVVIADLVITFDPTKLQALSAVPGNFFINPQQRGPLIDNIAGRIEYTVYIGPGSDPKQGQGTLVNVTFNALAPGAAIVGFGPDTIVGAESEETNVLVSSTPTTITIEAIAFDNPTPTATPAGSTDDDGSNKDDEDQPGLEGTSTPTSTASASPASGGTSGNFASGRTPTPLPTNLPQQLPDSGVAEVTIAMGAVGFVLLLGSLLFAL